MRAAMPHSRVEGIVGVCGVGNVAEVVVGQILAHTRVMDEGFDPNRA